MVQGRKDGVNMNIENKHIKLLKTSAFAERSMGLHFYSCSFSLGLIFFKTKKYKEEKLLPWSTALICYVLILKVNSRSQWLSESVDCGAAFISLQGRRSQPFNQQVLYNHQKFLISWNVVFVMRNLGRWR